VKLGYGYALGRHDLGVRLEGDTIRLRLRGWPLGTRWPHDDRVLFE
jgi:hypothetical protein